MRVRPPWSEQQVACLSAWQATDHVWPVTCDGAHDRPVRLLPTRGGWVCPLGCGPTTPTWAWSYMVDRPPPPPKDRR